MSAECREVIVERVRSHGPLTFVDFMELALYHPETGYYATATRRSGRTGDFFTSVDVGPVFGELLAEQIAEMARILIGSSEIRSPTGSGRGAPVEARGAESEVEGPTPDGFDLVEAGAGNGRLSRDVLDALEAHAPDAYARARLRLVEPSAVAREAQPTTLGRHARKLASSGPALPSSIEGIVAANELLDAMPTHLVVGRKDGLREIYVDVAGEGLVEREMPPSTPAIGEYFDSLGIRLLPDWHAEVNLRAVEWMREAGGALRRGFLVVIDYGHEAGELYSAAHAQGTLATFTGHVVEGRGEGRVASWLRDPGASDITAHVDFTSIRRAAEANGLLALCRVDQMHFLLALGIEGRLQDSAGTGAGDIRRRLALKTLLVPGGLGTTHHVMMFGKGVGRPQLRGCRGRAR